MVGIRMMRWTGGVLALAGLAVLAGTSGAQAQLNVSIAEAQARAARRTVLLAVEQGLGSLPPTGGQSVTFSYDAALGAHTPDENVGPTSLRTPRTLGQGKISFRLTSSVFEASEKFGRAPYVGEIEQGTVVTATGIDELSVEAWVFNLGATVGITDRLDVTLNVPLVNANAQGTTSTLTRKDCVGQDCFLALGVLQLPGETPQDAIDFALNDTDPRSGQFAGAPLSIAAPRFEGGNGVRLGRIALGAKFAIPTNSSFRTAAEFSVLFPSPDEEHFAGPDAFGVVPRLVFEAPLPGDLRLLGDVAYQANFKRSNLSNFSWGVGVGGAWGDFSADLGFTGAVYPDEIEWTPDNFSSGPNDAIDFDLRVARNNEVDNTYANFVFGLKYQVVKGIVLSGAVAVPVSRDGLAPDALGTLAFEYYFG